MYVFVSLQVQSKLKAFFERTTVDGPKYDTYLLYYSGSVYDSGDWALAGEHVIFTFV